MNIAENLAVNSLSGLLVHKSLSSSFSLPMLPTAAKHPRYHLPGQCSPPNVYRATQLWPGQDRNRAGRKAAAGESLCQDGGSEASRGQAGRWAARDSMVWGIIKASEYADEQETRGGGTIAAVK